MGNLRMEDRLMLACDDIVRSSSEDAPRPCLPSEWLSSWSERQVRKPATIPTSTTGLERVLFG